MKYLSIDIHKPNRKEVFIPGVTILKAKILVFFLILILTGCESKFNSEIHKNLFISDFDKLASYGIEYVRFSSSRPFQPDAYHRQSYRVYIETNVGNFKTALFGSVSLLDGLVINVTNKEVSMRERNKKAEPEYVSEMIRHGLDSLYDDLNRMRNLDKDWRIK